jgi:hypothetical protein
MILVCTSQSALSSELYSMMLSIVRYTRANDCSKSLATIKISLGASWVRAHHNVNDALSVVLPDFLEQL